MAKKVWKALDNLSPSDVKLTDLPRKSNGLYNLKFNEYGQLVKRKGYSKYNTTSIGAAHKIVGMHRYYKQNTAQKEFLVAWNEGIYKLAETTPWGSTAIKTGLTADSDTYFADFLNHCYFVNGVDGVFKYNLTNVRTMGITAPTVKCAGTAGGSGGSLGVGDYKYKYTWVDEDGYESNGSPVSDAITAASGEIISLTGIANSADPKVVSKCIYRTSLDGARYFYEGAIANNTTTTFSSTIADNALGTELHTDHTTPPTDSNLITKRRNRLLIADDGDLIISHLSDCEYFPSAWFIKTGNRQKITGLVEQLAALPVFTDDSVERLVGTDEDNFEFKNSYSTEGCISVRSLVNCDNLLVYLGFNGINYFDGVSSGIFSKAINKYIKDNINGTYRHLSCGAYFDDKYLLCYPKGANTVPSETIWIDLKNHSYGVYNFAFSCFSRWDRGTDGLKLKGGSNTEGRIYSVFDGLDDDGSDITAYDDVEPLDFGKPEVYKNWWSVFYKIKTTTGTAFTFYYKLDNASSWSSATKTLTADTTLWYRVGLGPGGKRGRALKPKPYMSDKYAFEIHGMMICYDEEAFAEEKE